MTDKNKMSSFFIYSPDEKERNEIFQLIKLTQMSLNIKGQANSCLNGMKKILFKNDQFYVIAKILAVKRKCKNKIKLRKYLNKNILEKDKKKFNEFKNEIKNKIKLKYIEERKYFYNKSINRDMKQLLLHSKFIKKKSSNNSDENSNIKNITKAVYLIYEKLKKPNNISNIKYRNNATGFKVTEINNIDKTKSDINLVFNYNDISMISIGNNSVENTIYLNRKQIFELILYIIFLLMKYILIEIAKILKMHLIYSF